MRLGRCIACTPVCEMSPCEITEKGSPLWNCTIVLACQPVASHLPTPLAPEKNFLFAPNGSSHVPLKVARLRASYADSPRSALRLLGIACACASFNPADPLSMALENV